MKICFSPPRHNLQIHQPRCQPVGQKVGGVGKVFNELKGYSIGPVNHIEYFQAGPDIFKIAERGMAAALAAVFIHQQGAKTNISTDIGIDKCCIPVFY